ncbi:MAG: 30S ribosomal protein S6 [Deltaproteobacteria bacterium]|nr:30S ribosomal protein S6 [Deltaproteobacteria bacterium]
MKIRRYETLFLLNSDISEEEITEIQKKCTDVIDQMHGRLLSLNNWGYRQLAYEIKGQNRGFYFLMDCAGQPEILAEVERLMGLDERVFRFMTIVLEKIFDEEKYERVLAKKEEAERKAKEEAEARQAALEAEAKAVEEAEAAQAALEAQAESSGEAEETEEATSEAPAAVEEAAPETNDTQDAEPDQETTDPASD